VDYVEKRCSDQSKTKIRVMLDTVKHDSGVDTVVSTVEIPYGKEVPVNQLELQNIRLVIDNSGNCASVKATATITFVQR
jgi:hypothetical protein